MTIDLIISLSGSSYSKILNVVQHQVDGDRTSSLQVTVKNQQSNVGQNMSRSVSVTLTDPHEYFFYYSVTLTEEDFTNLKQIQGLLVDFSNFPNMLGKFHLNNNFTFHIKVRKGVQCHIK